MFQYEYAASKEGVVHERAIVDEKGTWGDFKQSHADMALNSFVIFNDLTPTRYELVNVSGLKHTYKFRHGDYDKAAK